VAFQGLLHITAAGPYWYCTNFPIKLLRAPNYTMFNYWQILLFRM